MPDFEIIKAGLMTSIQDSGRNGLAYFAIPSSGVMDRNAAKIALLLLNKDDDSPLIECTSIAPHLLFNGETQISITGADFNWTVNGKKINRNTVISINKGDLLKGQFAKNGLRGYIAIKAEMELDKIYNSYATYVNAKIGGYQGRLLQKGDIIKWKAKNEQASNFPIIPICKGPEFQQLTTLSKHLLRSNIYTIGSDSNRMGARLKGPELESSVYQLKHSAPVLPGFIQLPPSGLPIVVLQDGQSSGGYPRIAYIRENHLPLFNQIPLGGKFQFHF